MDNAQCSTHQGTCLLARNKLAVTFLFHNNQVCVRERYFIHTAMLY